eukprot:g7186.t1
MSDEREPTGQLRDEFSTNYSQSLPPLWTSNLRKFCRGFTRAFKREKTPCEDSEFDPELLCNRKKEWLDLRSYQETGLDWPQHCFEHFLIVGLPHTINITEIIESISRLSKKPSPSSDPSNPSETPNHTPPKPSYTAELLYQFPHDKELHMNVDELTSFCFPHGVTPQLLKRTPSMSAMDDVIYGQQHIVHSDQSFVFMQKGGGNRLPMFGVCYLVNQMIQTPPGLVRNGVCDFGRFTSKHLVAAPRCYCLLSRYPFFKLHFQILNLILGLERLDCISQYMQELIKFPSHSTSASCCFAPHGDSNNQVCRGFTPDSCAIPAFSGPAPVRDEAYLEQQDGFCGFELDFKDCCCCTCSCSNTDQECQSMDRQSSVIVSYSDAECQTPTKTLIHTRDSFSSIPGLIPINFRPTECKTGTNSVTKEQQFSNSNQQQWPFNDEITTLSKDSGLLNKPESERSFQSRQGVVVGSPMPPRYPDPDRPISATPRASNHRYTRSGESDEIFMMSSSMPDLTHYQQEGTTTTTVPNSQNTGLNSVQNLNSVFKCSQLGGAAAISKQLSSSTRGSKSWIEAGLRTSPGSLISTCLKILCQLMELKVPDPGETLVFNPDEENLQSIEYTRPKQELCGLTLDLKSSSLDFARIEMETAFGLRTWTVAVLCRSLSLDNILTLLAGALLEKQIVFFCSNIGVLTSAVLSLLPLLQPFTWHSLILPVLPSQYLDFLEAPVPFAVGVQHKTQEIALKCKDLIRVNLYKDKIKNGPVSNVLPGSKQLHLRLTQWHRELQECSKYCKRPCHLVTQRESNAVDNFMKILRSYLTGILGDLQRHTITDVTSGTGVSLLLEESFLSAFSTKDQSFMKAFMQTQIFSSYVDNVISKC